MTSLGRPAGEYGHYRPRPFTPRPRNTMGSIDDDLGELAERVKGIIEERTRRHRKIRPDRRSSQDGQTLIFANGRMICECAMNEAVAWKVERDPRLQIIGVYTDGISWEHLLLDLRDVGTI